MSNNQKILEQFDSFSVKKPSESRLKTHIYADYLELISLITKDYVSQSDFIDRLQDSGEEFEVSNVPDGNTGITDTQKNDSAEYFANTIFEYITERNSIYKESYPFEISTELGIKLKEKKYLTIQQELYIYLLIASSLSSFQKTQSIITSEFETLSVNVLKSYLPDNAKVVNFSQNDIYIGNAKEKIKQLAKEINIEYNSREIEQISDQNSKEEGLDIVGWIPFEDNNPNTIIIFGQCACGKDWFGKQNDTLRYENYLIPYRQPFTHSFFIPYDLKNTNGRFNFSKDIITNHLIFERRRILSLVGNDIFNYLNYSQQIIEKCLNYQEDIV